MIIKQCKHSRDAELDTAQLRETARQYLNFVNLWKNAGAELQPQVAEVKRRLARLSDVERPRARD